MDKFFKISERGSNIRTEIIAGLTTFFAMAYIVITNPSQITGGPVVNGSSLEPIWNSVYVASLIAAVVGTLMMALYAKMPFAQACGMGLNSFFFISFIQPALLNDDPVQGYQAGLVIILLSGLIFLLLSVSGLRSKIARALPDCLKKAIPAGIGLFIAFVGFQNAGIIIEGNEHTIVQLNDFHGSIVNGTFLQTSLPALLAIGGLLLVAVLEKLRVKGAILITIGAVTVAYYAITATSPDFDMHQVGKSFQDFGTIGVTGVFQGAAWQNAFDGFTLGGILSAVMLIITFCLVDMFDTIGTLYGTASQANMLDEKGDPINVDKCMTCDSVATVAGATLGTSTCTTFVESSAGVGAGGRTGLASVVTAICFFLCLFLTPLAKIVPACATAPALIYVGMLMLKGFSKVDMDDVRSAIPAFLALIMMPLTYSISNGIGIGCIAYTLITLFTGKYTKKDMVVTVIAVLFAVRFCLITM